MLGAPLLVAVRLRSALGRRTQNRLHSHSSTHVLARHQLDDLARKKITSSKPNAHPVVRLLLGNPTAFGISSVLLCSIGL